MPDLPTRVQLFQIGRQHIVGRNPKIDPEQINTLGSDANIIVGSTSVIAAQVIAQLGYRTGALTLDGCETDEDLDRYAYDRYQELRKGASAATTSVRIFRAAAGVSGDVPIGTKLTTATGVEYITTTVATFGTSDLTSRADVRASDAGKATQVGAGQIVRFSQPGTLFDRTLQCFNDQAAAGGEDAEDNETFKARLRDFWRTARRGILAAIEFGAKQVPGVVSAQAVEVLTSGGQPARLVQLYIADSSGVASDTLARAVYVALDDYRGAGIQVLVSTSVPFIVDITLKLTFKANVDTATLSDNIRAAVVAFVNSLPVNGPLYRAELESVLQRYVEDGLVMTQNTLVTPVGDLIPAVGQTLRTTAANVTIDN